MRSITILCSVTLSIIVALGIIGLLNLSIGSNVTVDQNNVRQSLSVQNPQQGSVQVLNHQMTKTLMGNWVVKGQLINYGTVKINYAVVNVEFMDKYGNILYTGPVNINDMDPGEKEDFEVSYYGPGDKLNSYKIFTDTMA